MKSIMKQSLKGLVFVTVAMALMGNESCEKKDERQLRRRVQMGKVTAPPLPLPTQQYNGQKFDFAYAANTQMSSILQSTTTFSTAAIDPNETYRPDDLSEGARETFYQCGDDDNFQEFGLFTNAREFTKMGGEISKNASCLIGSPNGVINAAVVDFSFRDGFGVDLNLKTLPIDAFNFNVETYQLRINIEAKAAYDYTDSFHSLAAITHDENANKGQVGAGLNFADFGLGFKYYYQSPLGKLTSNAFSNGLNKLKEQWDQDPANKWYAMVLRSCDKYVYLDAGGQSDSGLKVGDIVEIKNVKYMWSGKRCASHLTREIDAETIGYAVIKNIGRNLAEAWIIENDPKYPRDPSKIHPGARAYMHKMVEQVDAEKKQQK